MVTERVLEAGFDGGDYGFPTVILSSLFFYINNYWVLKTFAPASATGHPKKAWKWRNTANSLIHSFITGTGTFLCFWWTPKMREDLVYPISLPSYLLVSFSLGYFIYDLIDMAVNGSKPKTYDMLLHHFMVILCFAISIITERHMGFTLMALSLEVNSVFLHLRQLMILQGWSKSSNIYRINNSFNLGTFIVFRVLTLGWMTRWLIHNRMDLHNYVYYVAGTSLAVIMVMNTVLLQKLLNSDYWQCPKPSTEDHLKAK